MSKVENKDWLPDEKVFVAQCFQYRGFGDVAAIFFSCGDIPTQLIL